ncbi:MAG TPA: hypothetical protein VG937_38450 [Polyangiaceae bacterium]|nr:hypothetical protein [Polyangiaceae bacterium]
MQLRAGLRAHTSFPVFAGVGRARRECRAVEVSPSGIVLEREDFSEARPMPLLMRIELRLPERLRPLIAWARPIWSHGKRQALKFVGASDADRLSLAEHLDLQRLRGWELK